MPGREFYPQRVVIRPILVAVLVFCSTPMALRADVKQFAYPEFNCHLSVPDTWRVIQHVGNCVLMAHNKDNGRIFLFKTTPMELTSDGRPDYAAIAGKERANGGVVISSRQWIKMRGLPCYRMVAEASIDGKKVRYLEYIIMAKERIYYLTEGENEIKPEQDDEMKDIIASFDFIKPEPSSPLVVPSTSGM